MAMPAPQCIAGIETLMKGRRPELPPSIPGGVRPFNTESTSAGVLKLVVGGRFAELGWPRGASLLQNPDYTDFEPTKGLS